MYIRGLLPGLPPPASIDAGKIDRGKKERGPPPASQIFSDGFSTRWAALALPLGGGLVVSRFSPCFAASAGSAAILAIGPSLCTYLAVSPEDRSGPKFREIRANPQPSLV